MMTIGDFSRATRLSAKTLRFYHQVGLLSPARVDPANGYRLYGVGQISDAQVIRTYRSLDMSVDLIRKVLAAPDVADRDRLIGGHLTHMEDQLETTRSAVSSLRSLLQASRDPFVVEHRSLPPFPAVVIREEIELSDLSAWYGDAMRDLDRLIDTGIDPVGPRGGMWDTDLFLNERGGAALYVPTRSLEPDVPGRARAEFVASADLVVAAHRGTDDTIAEVYGALGRYVAEHGISASGPIRETYLVRSTSAQDETVTEIGWPVIRSAR
ncbi:MerR family transcriptional regulator [Cryobacterium zhongshanensis]|uniref:MerR family transcriptional regulator n=1 Tax=Cryobacterium zhongshanensis TaxID=2928153 RepID=A0AA41QZ37_9MICO|nr:MerR family transcriptional regulator [Cryobacterium zhongshanensis]MCI4659493.1 MerR family transcriptional regulator [Cryobacterium zhongshanensis]